MPTPTLPGYEVDWEALERLPADRRVEVAAQLARFRDGASANPLWAYFPHEKQRIYHAFDVPLGVFAGGNRAGKSVGGTVDDIVQVVDRSSVPPWLQPFKRWDGECHRRVGTPNLRTTLKGVVLPLFKRYMPKDQLIGGRWERSYNGEDRVLTLANGNTIDFLTYEMEVDAWSGVERHGIRFDEEPRGYKGRRLYDESLMRLLSTGGEFRMTFTPLLGLSWSYYEVTRVNAQGVRESRWDDEVRVLHVDMDDNPHLDEKTKRRALARMSPAERKARKEGRFIHFAGTIYPEWDPDRHVVPDAPLPVAPDGRLAVHCYAAIDPGREHPAAAVWAYVHDGVLTVFASLKRKGLNAEEFNAEMCDVEDAWGIKPRWSVIDPSALSRGHATGRSIDDEYRRVGRPTIPGQNPRLAGYNRVSQLLKGFPAGHPRAGEPRLRIMACNSNMDDELPGLIEEFPMYRWRERSQGEGASPQEPIKVLDDLLDALRYLVMSNPTGLAIAEDLEVPPDDPAGAAEWERGQLLKKHVKHLAARAGRRRRDGAVARRDAGSVV